VLRIQIKNKAACESVQDKTEGENLTKILDYFPKGFTPRPQQTEILKRIAEMENSYEKIILCMPTGSGKSPIAYALGKYYDSSFVLTATKNLQDQYKQSFPDVAVIKGKNNFKCDYLIDIKSTDETSNDTSNNASTGLDEFLDSPRHSLQHYTKNHLTCDLGPCTKKEGNADETCRYKTSGTCDYYSQRDYGLSEDLAILNYPLYFQLRMLPVPLVGMFRKCIIYDEAHELEDQILNFVSIEIGKKILENISFFIKKNEINDIDDIADILDSIRRRCSGILRDMENGVYHNKLLQYKPLQKFYDKCSFVYGELLSYKENFVFSIHFDNDDNFVKLKITPLDISRYAKKFFTSPKQFFMSATIDKKYFSKLLGFDESDMAFLEIKKSPFPLPNRKVIFSNIREISSKHSTFEDHLAMVHEIENIMNHHNDQKGLILTSSKERCNFIVNNIEENLKYRIIEGHSKNQDGTTIVQSMKRHYTSENTVLLSSSMWEGVDLKDDLARFCILEKCPFPFLGDVRIKKKTTQDKSWYSYKTLTKILQGMGRCVRAENDYSTLYSLDKKIEIVLQRNYSMIPESYRDMLCMEESN